MLMQVGGLSGEHVALAQMEKTMLLLVETVRGDFEGFTKKEIAKASEAPPSSMLELSRMGMYIMYPYLESHKSREPVPS
jgi:hypothetical protein